MILADHQQRIRAAIQVCEPVSFAAAALALRMGYPEVDEKVIVQQILNTCSAEVQHWWIDGS